MTIEPKSWYMLPSYPIDGIGDGTCRDAVPDSQGLFGDASGSEFASDFLNERSGKFSSRNSFAERARFRPQTEWVSFALGLSPLGHHVGHVIGVCTEKQVVWSDAKGSVVAPVEYPEAIRNWTVMEFPREAAGGSLLLAIYSEMADAS